MRIINKSNLNKTIRYLKKNGLASSYYAAIERIKLKKKENYTYVIPDEDELCRQRQLAADWISGEEEYAPLISIVMPTYNTPEKFLIEAVESVICQTYPNWELIIADATEGAFVRERLNSFEFIDIDNLDDYSKNAGTLRYLHLLENGGISDNTNAGIKYARGEYVALLDHDDFYTPDALFEMVNCIREHINTNESGEKELPEIIYSDEDKYDSDTESFYDPHRKYDFNYDLLLTNNYICHLIMLRRDLFGNIRLRRDYDGAQDYDLVLQVIRELIQVVHIDIPKLNEHLVHVPKVLYHWRSHANSTADNTASKTYAYEAGLRALDEFVHEVYASPKKDRTSIMVTHSKHLGFYKVKWGNSVDDYFDIRPEVGGIAVRILDKHGKMKRCLKDEAGNWLYEGINEHFSGELNRFDCAQNVYYAIPEAIIARPSIYKDLSNQDEELMQQDISEYLHRQGYLITYIPEMAKSR